VIDGLQAEYARVPFADTSVYRVPEALSDDQVLFLAHILPTAFECGALKGRVQLGDTVAIVGAGPIGLAAIMTAKLFMPGKIVAVDLDASRLAKALEFGADNVNNGREDALARIRETAEPAWSGTADCRPRRPPARWNTACGWSPSLGCWAQPSGSSLGHRYFEFSSSRRSPSAGR
jgi:threonine dehydrogenase-like Zn-dependent dehydrogenase